MGVSVFRAIHRSFFAKLFYFVLAVAFFLGFGILSSVIQVSPFSKIKIGDREVASDEFMLVLKDISGNLPSDADEDTLLRMAFDLLVARKVISMEFENWGFYVGDKDIVKLVAGSFGLKTYRDYRNLLRTVGATERSFENYLKDSYFFIKFQDLVLRMQTAGDMEEFNSFITSVAGSRILKIAKIKKSAFHVKIPKKEIRKYYLLNKDKFKVPEKREFWIAKFPSETTARTFYSESKGKKFGSFADFEKYVFEKGGDPVPAVVGKSEAIRSVVYSALFGPNVKEGEFLEPVKVDEKWWVIYVSKIHPETTLTLEEATPQIKSELMSKFIKRELEGIIKKVERKIKKPEDFEKFFRKYSTDIYTETVPVYIDIFPHVGVSSHLSSAVFSDRENFIFGILENMGQIYVVFVGEKFPAPNMKVPEFLTFDAERIIQGFIASAMSDIEIEPPSREKAIAKLVGEER